MMRLRRAVLLFAASVAVLLGHAAGAQAAADGSDLTVAIQGDQSGTPVVVLTNRGARECQVVVSALGTIALNRVEQDGHEVAPVPIIPSFDDDLGYQLSQQLRTLAPGAAVELPLDVVEGPGGPVLRTVSWSPSATIGASYAIDLSKSVTLDVRYAAPISVDSGPPLCTTAQGTGVSTKASDPASSIVWIVIVAAGVALLIGLTTMIILSRRRGRRARAIAGAVVVVVAASVAAVGWRPEPASATIYADGGISDAATACLKTMRAPGGDPRNILPKLDDPSVRVEIKRGSNSESRYGPNNIWIYWQPDDRRPFEDGVAREPCDELYHELYHGFEDTTPQGVDLHECITAGGKRTGIAIKEVNATKAENERRRNLGRPQRGVYGTNPLPPGECRPSKPDDPLCHPERGCPKPPEQPGQSSGDPHLVTFDKRRFSFQGLGEFVAVRDTAAADPTTALQVQVRQQPWPYSRQVTYNTAVAANVAGDRVEVRLGDNDRLVVLVNGTETPLATAALPKGGKLTYTPRASGDLITVDWPDKTYALVAANSKALALIVVPGPGHEGTLTGLLGNNDGDLVNDLTTKAGSLIEPPTYDDLYPAYADRMRITQQSSLFTYPAGTNTETFTDRNFPDRTPPPLPNRAWAESLCRQFGVTDPISLTECITDVANTGNASFLAASVVAQSTAASFRVGGSGATVGITRPGEAATVTFAGIANQKLYVDVVSSSLPDACGVLTLKDPTGKVLGTGCITNGKGAIDAVTLPVTGTYTVTVDPPGNATGETTLALIVPTDQGSELAQGGAEATITIGAAGAVGRLTFAGSAGQVVYIDVVSSTLADQCGVITVQDPTKTTISSGCVTKGKGQVDRTVLPTTGTYSVVVDPAGTATGTVRLRLIRVVDYSAPITVDGPEVVATLTRAGAVAQLTFTGTAGQIVYLDIPSATLTDQCAVATIRDPAGTTLTSGCIINGKGYIDRTVLPATGSYTVVLDPAEMNIGEVHLRLTRAVDQAATITVGGPTVTASIAQAGAVSRFTFSGNAGQKVVLDVTSSTLPDQCAVLTVQDAAGQTLGSGCVIGGKGGITSITLPSSGTYTVVVDPATNTTGTATLRLHT